jgi:hypothetical protein
VIILDQECSVIVIERHGFEDCILLTIEGCNARSIYRRIITNG